MYNFILSMWVAGTIDEHRVRSYCPLFITPEQRDMILATPQLEK